MNLLLENVSLDFRTLTAAFSAFVEKMYWREDRQEIAGERLGSVDIVVINIFQLSGEIRNSLTVMVAGCREDKPPGGEEYESQPGAVIPLCSPLPNPSNWVKLK